MNTNNPNSLTGVIIAAGNGRRMRSLGSSMPKALLMVNHKPIIEHQLESMESAGIKQAHIVVGYLKEQIMGYIHHHYNGNVDISFAFQEKQEGIAHAILPLESVIKSNFIVFLGDIYILIDCLAETIQKAAANPQNSYIFCKRESDKNKIKKNFSVELYEGSDLVRRVVEKPENPLSGLKGCGLYIFTPRIFEAIRETPKSKLRNEYEITDAIQTLINKGNTVCSVDCVMEDVNVNSPEDVLELNRYVNRMIGEGALR